MNLDKTMDLNDIYDQLMATRDMKVYVHNISEKRIGSCCNTRFAYQAAKTANSSHFHIWLLF